VQHLPRREDFRELERHFLDLGDGALTKVKEAEEYPYASLDEGKYTYKVEKFGRKFKFSWEALSTTTSRRSRPSRPARHCCQAHTEKLATSLICDASGPDATFLQRCER